MNCAPGPSATDPSIVAAKRIAAHRRPVKKRKVDDEKWKRPMKKKKRFKMKFKKKRKRDKRTENGGRRNKKEDV